MIQDKKILIGFLIFVLPVMVHAQGYNDELASKQEASARVSYSSVEMTQETITGTVADGQSGQTLPGVNVMVKGTSTGTATNADGQFELSVPSLQDTLVASFVGYQTKEVPINGQTELKIVLQPQAIAGEELVVVGYGTKKKENLTAAVEMVDTDVLENRPVKSLGEVLAGTVPNLNINIASGAPDANPSFNIRGFTGFNTAGPPLILVDGVEQDINTVNPNDVESVSVLKGAAATAIYGSRAPNGAIIITTKAGSKNMPLRVNYSANFDINQPSHLPHTMNSVAYARYTNMAFNNQAQEGYYTDEVIQKMQDYIDGNGPNKSKKPDGTWGAHNDAHSNTDYYGYAFRDYSADISHNLGVEGGSETTSYYMGLGYNTQQGVYDTEIDNYDRLSTILKVNSDVNEWFSIGLSTRYTRINTERPNYQGNSSPTSAYNSDRSFMGSLSYFPNVPVKNPDGNYHWLSAMPMLEGLQGKLTNTRNDFWINSSIEIKPAENLRLKSRFNWNSNNLDAFESIFRVDVIGGDGRPRRSARSTTYDGIVQNTYNEEYYQFETFAEYSTDIQDHSILLLTGFQQEYKKYNNFAGNRRGLYSTNLPTFSTAYGDQMNINDRVYEWATQGFYFRSSYDYKEKYLIDFNARYDASSKFSPDERWAFFPSVSVGYNLANEFFWPLKENIEMFKITGSWGKSGNHGTGTGNSDLFTYLPTLNTGRTNILLGGDFQPFVSRPPLLSEDLTWAKPRTIGLGLETQLFDNRLQAEYRWYQRTVFDQFSPPEQLPEVLGASVPATNNGTSETRGWEASIGWSDQAFNISGSPLQYSVKASMSDYIGYVVDYGKPNTTGVRSGTWTRGEQFGVLYGYESAGIAPDEEFLVNHVPANNDWYYPGDLYYKDINGDGQINTGEGGVWYAQGDRQKLGYNYPRYTYNIYLKTSWKGLGLSILLNGVGHQKVYIANSQTLGLAARFWSTRTALSLHEQLGGYWALDNQDAFFPRTYLYAKNGNRPNDQYMLNLAHLRIKNINLSYNLPNSLLDKFQLIKASINFSVENAGLIFSKSWLDLHPIHLRSGALNYPLQRTFSLGINVGI